jgi:hypothetical protein
MTDGLVRRIRNSRSLHAHNGGSSLSQIIYTGPLEGVVTPDGTRFPKGVPVDVPDELASALLLQAFAEASAPQAPAPAPIQPAVSFTAPAALPDAAPPAPAPTPVPDPIPALVLDQGAAVLAPVSGVTA